MELNGFTDWALFLGVPAIFSGFTTSVLGKVFAEKILEKDRHKYDKAMTEIATASQEQIETHKNKLEMDTIIFNRYSEHQFNLYNELYTALYELKLAVDSLWNKAEDETLNEFSMQFTITKNVIGKRALLIEDTHFDQLKEVISTLAKLKIGKKKLINIKRIEPNEGVNKKQIEFITNKNKLHKDNYNELLIEMRKSFRSQMVFRGDCD